MNDVDENSRLSEASRKEVSEAHTLCQQLKEEKKSLQEQLEEAHAAAEVSSILNQELEEKEEEIRQLNKKSMWVCIVSYPGSSQSYSLCICQTLL